MAKVHPVARSPERLLVKLNLPVLLSIVLFAHLVFMEVPEWGGDALFNWFHAKQIAAGVPIDQWTHHTARWILMVPAAFSAWIFGDSAFAYVLWPLQAALLLCLFLYQAVRKSEGDATAVVAVLWVGMFPPLWRHGTQLLPGVLSALFLFSGVLALRRALGDPGAGRSAGSERETGALAGVLFLGAYFSHITTLFMLPGFAWVLLRVRRHRVLAWMAGVMALGFVVETLFYGFHLGQWSGRLGVIAGSHFHTGGLAELGFIELLTRFYRMNGSWRLFLYLGIAAMVFLRLTRRSRREEERLWAAGVLSFLFFLIFGVKSLDPLVPFVKSNERYLMPVVPFLGYFFAKAVVLLGGRVVGANSGLQAFLRSLPARVGSRSLASRLTIGGAAMLLIWVASGFRGPGAALIETSRLREEINSMWARGDVIAVRGKDWKVLKYLVYRMALERRFWVDTQSGLTRYPATWRVVHEGNSYFVSRNEVFEEDLSNCAIFLLGSERGPFRRLRLRPIDTGCAAFHGARQERIDLEAMIQ